MKLSRVAIALLVAVCVWSPTPAAAEQPSAAGGRFRIAYATFIGGSQWDQPREIIPYPDGSVLVGGQSSSPDLPVTEGVVQPKYAGEPAGTGHGGLYSGDCFVVRIGPRGERIRFLTYFGGSKQERAVYGMALDRKGNIVITTGCRSRDLPTTKGAYQRKYGGGMADVMIVKVKADGTGLVWATLLGGSDWDGLMGARLDPAGNVYVAGHTRSRDLPVTDGAAQRSAGGQSDCFLACLSADGRRVRYCTYLGGSGADLIRSVALGPGGAVYLAGNSNSADFPVSARAFQKRNKGNHDGVIIKLDPAR